MNYPDFLRAILVPSFLKRKLVMFSVIIPILIVFLHSCGGGGIITTIGVILKMREVACELTDPDGVTSSASSQNYVSVVSIRRGIEFDGLAEEDIAALELVRNYGLAIGNLPEEVDVLFPVIKINGNPITAEIRLPSEIDHTMVEKMDFIIANVEVVPSPRTLDTVIMPVNPSDLVIPSAGSSGLLEVEFQLRFPNGITEPVDVVDAFVTLSAGESEYRMFSMQEIISYTDTRKKAKEIIRIVFFCPDNDDDDDDGNFVELSKFEVSSYGNEIPSLVWTTGTEIDNAGFRLWRGIENGIGDYYPTFLREFGHVESIDLKPDGDCSTKIQGQLKEANPNQNHKLISAVGNSVESTCYSFTDTTDLGDGTYYYLLEDIDDGGKSTFHCDHIDAVTIGQGPTIDLPSAIDYCKKETGSED